jgi:hypothetical protein
MAKTDSHQSKSPQSVKNCQSKQKTKKQKCFNVSEITNHTPPTNSSFSEKDDSSCLVDDQRPTITP